MRHSNFLPTEGPAYDPALRRAFTRALRSLREQYKPNKLSQENLAHEIGLGRAYVGALERGEHEPCLGTLWRLKVGLKISMARLGQEIDRHYKAPNNGRNR